jgi:hypothetical protein
MAEDRLPEPYEILDLPDGGAATFRVRSWRQGVIDITPKGQTVKKTIAVLRVVVDKADKLHVPSYWDITSKLLTIQLLEDFKRPDLAKVKFTVKKFGVAPSARFSVAITPS